MSDSSGGPGTGREGARGHLERLRGAAVEAREARRGPAAGSKSVEEIARELLAPRVDEWIERHLARVVEAAVRDEVRRLARRVEDD